MSRMPAARDSASRRPPAAPRYTVVAGSPAHVPGIVACHAAAFPDQFMTLLGREFLAGYYRFYLSAPGAINCVAVGPDGTVLGFVSGGAPELRERFTREQVPRHAVPILLRAARDPRVRARLAVHARAALLGLGRRLGLKVPTPDEPPMDPPGTWSSLLSIAVRPDAGGQGIGSALMEAVRRASAQRGFRWMHLSVHNDNPAAIGLYRSSGWQVLLVTPGGTYFRRAVGA